MSFFKDMKKFKSGIIDQNLEKNSKEKNFVFQKKKFFLLLLFFIKLSISKNHIFFQTLIIN